MRINRVAKLKKLLDDYALASSFEQKVMGNFCCLCFGCFFDLVFESFAGCVQQFLWLSE